MAPGRLFAQWSSRPALISLPSSSERWGVPVGSFRIWPRLGVEGHYDSNLNRQDASEGPSGAGSLRILPGLTVVTPEPRLLRLQLDIAGDIRIYFGNDRLSSQTNAGGQMSLDVELFPRGRFVVRFFDRFRRDLQARSYAGDQNYNRNYNLAGLQLLLRPGGRALQFGVEYAFGIDFFDQLDTANKMFHDFGLHVVWKFYPLTAAFLEVDFKIFDYNEAQLNETLSVPNRGSMPLRAVIGMSGYVTKRLTLLLQAGWAQGFYEAGPSFGGPIGLARLGYHVTKSTLLQIGYGRDYEDAYWANYYGEHRVFLSAQQQFFDRRLDLQVKASYHFMEYARFVPEGAEYTVSQSEREEHALRLGVTAQFDITRWLGLTVGYSYTALFSDFVIRHEGEIADVPTFHRHGIHGSLVGRW